MNALIVHVSNRKNVFLTFFRSNFSQNYHIMPIQSRCSFFLTVMHQNLDMIDMQILGRFLDENVLALCYLSRTVKFAKWKRSLSFLYFSSAHISMSVKLVVLLVSVLAASFVRFNTTRSRYHSLLRWTSTSYVALAWGSDRKITGSESVIRITLLV